MPESNREFPTQETETDPIDNLLQSKKFYEDWSRRIDDMPEGPEKEEEKEKIYDDEGSFGRLLFTFLSAGDLTYTPSELKMNPKTGKMFADELREQEGSYAIVGISQSGYNGIVSH